MYLFNNVSRLLFNVTLFILILLTILFLVGLYRAIKAKDSISLRPETSEKEIFAQLSKDKYFDSITTMLALLTYATNLLFTIALIMTILRFF